MDWRCTECGRIRDTRTEPCACGAQEFERATARHTKRCTECGATTTESTTVCPECGFSGFEPLGVDGQTAAELDTSYEQWRCTECGRTTPRNTPPCDRCGNMEFKRERVEDASFDVDDYVQGGPAVSWRLVVAVLVVLVVVFLLGRVV